jgi:hypothetical protein
MPAALVAVVLIVAVYMVLVSKFAAGANVAVFAAGT